MKGCPKCGQRFLANEEFCPKDGATLVAMDVPEQDELLGTTIDGRYTINSKIGEGGMGVVYLATHAVIGKKCALKVLRKELSSESEVAERFTQEARAAAAIGNEHIIEITDFGQLPDGSAYFVMEYLEGRSIHDDLKSGHSIGVERTLHILGQCCDALSAAHSANIVHRDLKPENIVLIERRGDPDFAKILDFGIAKVARETGRLTRTGVVFGTPQYMSPEQAAGTDIDLRTDIYSLGIIMYEMLCGHVPFEADTFMGVLTKHLYEEPIPPRRLMPPIEVSQSVEAVLLKAISKKPEKRYQSMAEFGEDIKALADSKTPTIVYSQMRDTAMSTTPPPPPSEIIGGRSAARQAPVKQQGGPKWRIFAGVGAALVVVAVALTIIFFTSGKDSNATAQTQNVDTAQTAEADTGPAEVEEKDTGTGTAEAEEAQATVKLDSDPNGASLYKHGALVGKLPLELPKPGSEDEGSKYEVRLDGYQNVEIMVTSLTPDVFNVAMEEVPDSSHSSKPRRKKKKSSSSSSSSGSTQTKTKNKPTVGGDIADPWAE